MTLLLSVVLSIQIGVEVSFVAPEWLVGQAAVVLKDTQNDRILPIFIGDAEARAIEMVLEDIIPPRPMTHDLTVSLLKRLGAKIEKVVVTDLQENTFFAEIYLLHGKRKERVDARPSDAIALALRVGAPIFVDEKVFRKEEELRKKGSERKKKKGKGI